mmetsp:Transcript_2460/g.4942  ORF Transcript_2460/g.4942 Transcript_2460/m.4942 type:complete len:126 (+) Transcript_2460:48-425(+)
MYVVLHRIRTSDTAFIHKTKIFLPCDGGGHEHNAMLCYATLCDTNDHATQHDATRHPARRSRTTMHCGAVCHARTVSIRFDCIRFQLFIDALPRRDKTATRQQLYGELLWRDLQLNGTTRDQREA